MKRLLRAIFLVAIGASAICVTAPPASPPAPVIARGVTVSGIKVGGLTSEPARARLEKAAARPIVLFLGERRWQVRPGKLGASAAVNRAVSRALAARPRKRLQLAVGVRTAPIRRFVAAVAKQVDEPAQDARLVTLAGVRPVLSEAESGIAVERRPLERTIAAALRLNVRRPIQVPTKPVPPNVTEENFGPIVVISRGSNSLHLFSGEQPVRAFRVATGSARYPTPSGLFSIVDMQRNPWWRPPPSDWAKDEKPIPPGPGNPLGTRWMGISAPAVGIHGTPDAASLGYSVSHGCIRMQIPEAEWLFEQVHIGTPVWIV